MNRARAHLAVLTVAAIAACLCGGRNAAAGQNLVADPSFEETQPANQFGWVFKKWGGWKYEGDCAFRVGEVAHSGKTSCLLFGANQPKIRVTQTQKALPPGRYKITAYIRGLDIGEGIWRQTTELAFDGQYMRLNKNGTFGWTPLTYVADVKTQHDADGPSFGLMAPGYFWIDDVSLERVGNDVPLTKEPVLGKEESPIAPPGALGPSAVRCPECGYRNMPAWRRCYACGSRLEAAKVAGSGPAIKRLVSFDKRSPFDGGKVVQQTATGGTKALRLEQGYATWSGPQDWSGYDYFKAEVFAEGDRPVNLYIELRDQQTRDYWTRVNYGTLVPPGRSTLVLPIDQLFVGEKGRPGRKLMASGITFLALIVGDKPAGPVYFDNLRLERDEETSKMLFDGLYAFSLGPPTGPLMPGFTRINPSTVYSKGRGYGLKDAQIWRSFDVLQPEPLYQNFLCIEKGGLAVDLPDGKYHVFVNLDNPSGFWGEYQVYQSRAVLAQGKVVAEDRMTLESLKKKYFRFWDVEDSPADNTFDKYQKVYYREKEFDVDVSGGQLKLDFRGENFACSVSAVVIYPAAKAAQGRRFLDYVVRQRRFFFDNYFHRILHRPTGDPVRPTPEETRRGYVVFTRDTMQDVFYNDTPLRREIDAPVQGFAFAGQIEPLSVAIYPLQDLGTVRASIGDLTGPATIPSGRVSVGYVSNRVSRVAMDGSVYTIEPRYVMPRDWIDVRQGVTRRFWLTVHVPDDAPPGVYRGQLRLAVQQGQAAAVPVAFRVFRGKLDPVDIPVGPWDHRIHLPWLGEDPATQAWNQIMERRSLEKLHEYGFTTFSGLPIVRYLGFKDGKPQFDFSEGDRQMALARQCGFTMPVVSYVETPGLNLYYRDEDAMRAAGFSDYSRFLRAVFSAIQSHAEAKHWLPVYWNLGDEPTGDDLRRAAENAEAYRAAFPSGPPWFTAATSLPTEGPDAQAHLRFAKALHVADLNDHNEDGVRTLHAAGSDWAFYNGGNRWTYGVYLFKAAKQFGLKFRLNWHWNATAGDPYYALDCREDDYAWCNTNPDGELIPSLYFEREMRGGLDDYRCLLTLSRLAAANHDAAAQSLIQKRMDAFHLGQRDHDALFPASDWRDFRLKMATAIERLRGTP